MTTTLPGTGWMDEALCAGNDPELWFPEGRSPGPAKGICEWCPVQADCLDYALRHRIIDGIWGGTTRTERLRILLQQGATFGTCRHDLHVMDAGNTYITPDGHLRCKACRNAANRLAVERRQQRKEAA